MISPVAKGEAQMGEMKSGPEENPCQVLMEKTGWSVAQVAVATQNSDRNVRRWLATGEIGKTSLRLIVVLNTLCDLKMNDVVEEFAQRESSPSPSIASDLRGPREPGGPQEMSMSERLDYLEQMVDHVVDEADKVSRLPEAQDYPDLRDAVKRGREMLMYVRDTEAKARANEAGAGEA